MQIIIRPSDTGGTVRQTARMGTLVDEVVDAEDDGWDFWSRVYEDPTLRQELSLKTQKGPTVSELLRSDELCRGELIFLNVPRIGTGQQAVIRSLLNSQIGRNLPLLDITITNRRWKVRFYRNDDAQEVQRRFDGFRFKNKYLVVRFANQADTMMDYPHLMAKLQDLGLDIEAPLEPTPKIEEVAPLAPKIEPEAKILDPSWTPTEKGELESFKSELIVMLRDEPDGMLVNAALEQLGRKKRRSVVAVALDNWPSGVLRLCAPQVRLTGKYVSLTEQDNYRTLLTRTANQGASRVPSDDWEPMPPSNVLTEYHMVDYMTAMLTRFGPQHIKVDVPLRLLARSLPGRWPANAVELAEVLVSLSPCFMLFDDVLYLATNVRHRRILLDQLLPPKPRFTMARLPSVDTAEHPSSF